LAAALAYWRLAAAQERLALLNQAVDNAKTLQADIASLADGGDLPAVDKTRAAARTATVERERALAERELQGAQARLADALGIPLPEPENSPHATEPLSTSAEPAALSTFTPHRLAEVALAHRADLTATQQLSQAAMVLLNSAQANQRRVFDLSLSAGYAGLYESFDRQLLAPTAYWQALSGRQAGPSFSVIFKTRAPFANRQARGQLLQASALATRSAIESRERERAIALEVADALGALHAAAAEAARRSTVRDRTTQVFRASRELMRHGEESTIHVLLADEERLQADLEELAAKEKWAASVALLRFAVGLPISGAIPGPAEFRALGEQEVPW
jgi:outer membrane protein TolC